MFYLSMSTKLRVALNITIFMVSFCIQIPAFADAGLRLLSGERPGGSVNGLSQDGSIAAGTVIVGAGENDAAFVWSEISGITTIGYLPGQNISEANGISDDGLKIYGRGDQQPYFTWTSADGIAPITLPDGFSANFYAISGDGSALAGKYISPDDQNGPVPDEAFRIVGNTVTKLGFLSTFGSNQDRSIAYAISGDGTLIVGQSTSDDATYSYQPEAFRWTQSGGMVGLGFEVSGETHSETIARAVSRDGTVIAGTSKSSTLEGDTLYNIFTWTEATGMVQIYSSRLASEVNGISADGSVIVGMFRPTIATRETPGGFREPFRWSEANGMQSVIEWLQEAGVDTGTLDAGAAWSVSADGNTVGGNIRDQNNSDAGEWPFIAHVINDDVFIDGFE